MLLLFGIYVACVAIFAAMLGDFSAANLLIGSILTIGLMLLYRRQITPRPLAPIGLSVHLLLYAPVLFYFLLIDIVRGTWQVTQITLGLKPLDHPGIVRIPLGTHSPYGIGPVGLFVTLSPGSFMVDIDWEDRVMLVHTIDASDPDKIRRDAEKYYRLWEYGAAQSPREPGEPQDA